MKQYLAIKYRYDKGIESISDVMYCVTGKSGGGLSILPLICEIESEREMTLQEKIDEMYRQLETTNPKSKQKIRDLKRGIEKAKRMKRRELRKGTIIV